MTNIGQVRTDGSGAQSAIALGFECGHPFAKFSYDSAEFSDTVAFLIHVDRGDFLDIDRLAWLPCHQTGCLVHHIPPGTKTERTT
jgi:hypothetical protein